MKPDQITTLYFKDVDTPISLGRRDFIKKLGGGIIVVFCLGSGSLLKGWSQSDEESLENFNAYLRVKEDGRVDLYTGKVEMGQGIVTSLAQVLADELEVEIRMVDMVMGDTDLCPYDAGTWGSLTTRFADPVIRAAACEAREILKTLGAEHLGVNKEAVSAKNGKVFVLGDPTKKVSYAALTQGKKIVKSLDIKPAIKKAEDFKIIGKDIISLDAEAKVTGTAQYSGDILLPGMVHASIVRSLSFGAKKIAVDASGIEAFEGVELIDEGDLVAVVHSDPEVATKAAKKVIVTWEEPEEKTNNEAVFDYLTSTIKNGRNFEESGDLNVGKETSTHFIEASYHDGYKAHAPMETHTATCYFEGDELTMWCSTQTPFGTRDQVARALEIAQEKVHIKPIFIGGGFGGKIYNQQAVEAALISRACGKPVQVAWTRKEEFLFDRFRPAAVVNVRSGVDANGKMTSWEFDIYCAGTRGTKLFYEVPNNRTRMFDERNVHPVATGAWRAPGNNTTTFARESHIDVMANAVGIDALKFRLLNLKDEDLKKTLELAAKKFKWNRTKKTGHGFGIALGVDAGTKVAIITEVHVDKTTGKVTPVRIVCAQDMGQVVNPHGAKVQTEGGITMGLGYALTEEIEFNGSRVRTRNFSNYDIAKFSITPPIECVFIDKMNSKPQGGGEPAIICVGGAIANAVFDACGARVRRMPVTAKRVLEALKNT